MTRRGRTFQLTFLVLVSVLLCVWLLLYFDSALQERRAESLIADLKQFPFATATFTEVREFAIRHGGTTIQSFPPELPGIGVPAPPDTQRKVVFPVVRTEPACTEEDCTFQLWIRAGLAKGRLTGETAEFWYSVAHLLHIRSWSVYSRFHVHSGRLEDSTTAVVELRTARCYSYNGLIVWGYEANSYRADNYHGYYPWSAGFPHVTGPPSNVLDAQLPQRVDAPTQLAFDIHLNCLNNVLSDCRDIRQLAPSAWAAYRERRASADDAQCH